MFVFVQLDMTSLVSKPTLAAYTASIQEREQARIAAERLEIEKARADALKFGQ